MAECLVLPGLYGILVQALLFSCCVGILYVKKKREDVKLGEKARSTLEFCLDSAKQFAGCGWLHVMNLLFASLQDAVMQGGDQCSWYWINIMVDTTLGTAVEYALLKIVSAIIRKKGYTELRSGDYKVEDGQLVLGNFLRQLGVWLAIVSAMKILMVLVMFIFSGWLLGLAGFILSPFLQTPALKLLVVMIVFPIIMDGFQLWVTDNFIKKRESQHRSVEAVEGETDDEELGPYAEASAEALIKFSERCEKATEETLLSVKTQMKNKCKEAFDVDGGELSMKKKGMNEEDFQTQFNFVTRVPVDQM